MIQGCGSDVGKSVLVAGLCRLFANRGLSVSPFKPQNMSNNAAACAEGGEIGRAQALQARACRKPPAVDMNPVLLKPDSDLTAQVILQGRAVGRWRAGVWAEARRPLLEPVLESFHRLEAASDLVIVEGAGSPAETNLRDGDIANMGFARACQCPVVLVGDIDRGHVIAALVGAHAVLDPDDRALIQGFIVNKFRGDSSLFDGGRHEIVRRTGWRDIGLVPWLRAARLLPSEDTVVVEGTAPRGAASSLVVAPLLPRIANADEFDALGQDPRIDFRFVAPGTPIPAQADLVVLPGTKSTLADLAFLRAEGWDIDIQAHVRRGGAVMGVCGGYQMLGRTVADPHGVEGGGEARGLGLLDVETVLSAEKQVRPVAGQLATGERFRGYEIHCGVTTGPGRGRPFLDREGLGADGAVSADGRIWGAYVHGLFDDGQARAGIMARIGSGSDGVDHEARIEAALDELARELERCVDIGALSRIAGL